MAGRNRKKEFDLHLKIALTERGTGLFLRQKKGLSKFRMTDTSEEYGLLMENGSPASIQRFLLADCISKIEAANIDPLSARSDIIDLAKLIVHSLLYRHFDAELLNRVLASEIVVRWNRANPQSLIDEKAFQGSASSELKKLVGEKAPDVEKIRKLILDPLKLGIAGNARFDNEEKKVQILQVEKFMDISNALLWYILLKFQSDWNFRDLTLVIRSCLVEYLKKVRIADYIALMIMELALASEYRSIRKEAAIAELGGLPGGSPGGLPEGEKLDSIIRSLKAKNSLVSIAWKMGGNSSSIGTERRLQVVLYDRSADVREIRSGIDEVKSADVRKRSIYSFYREQEDGKTQAGLGLYYISYLEEACERVDIKFEYLVNQIPDTDITMITLSFIL
ncbi:MAG: hypothetical protein LBK40_02740 [Spirochaetaceae bacterium]|jgi:hypothetical protein|nr:hypothetical protein [Spirochaetaceae bacterium]